MLEINPYLALFTFFIFTAFLLIIFYPNKGIIAAYRKLTSNSKRIQIEDSLKHIYDYESHKLDATLNSIAGNLGISADNALKIVQSLKKLKLVQLKDQSINLTENGKNYALRIIRVHRLWESYLAEETGLRELDWHDEAEKIEHIMSEEEANLLSAKIGNPKFDPHGDPIPASDGTLVFNKGILLNTVEIEKIVKIIHIEDEPKAIYTELVDLGFYPGKELKILDKVDGKIKIAADGKVFTIPTLYASKLSVDVLETTEFFNKKVKTLAELKIGEEAKVINVAPNCRGQQRRRLLDFGIVPGAKVTLHMNSPLKDPTAYLVKDTIVALRKNQAKLVLIES